MQAPIKLKKVPRKGENGDDGQKDEEQDIKVGKISENEDDVKAVD